MLNLYSSIDFKQTSNQKIYIMDKIINIMSIMEITSIDDWNTQVLNSSTPVFVDFYADWCGPCKMVGPVVAELAGEYSKVKFVKVNVDQGGDISSKYNVFSIPTVIIIKDGKTISRQIGAVSKETYQEMIDYVFDLA